jgi:hypothetical protein
MVLGALASSPASPSEIGRTQKARQRNEIGLLGEDVCGETPDQFERACFDCGEITKPARRQRSQDRSVWHTAGPSSATPKGDRASILLGRRDHGARTRRAPRDRCIQEQRSRCPILEAKPSRLVRLEQTTLSMPARACFVAALTQRGSDVVSAATSSPRSFSAAARLTAGA